jgi:hypothetical protein
MAKVKLGLDDSELRSGLAAAGAKLNAFQQKTVSDFGKVSASLNNAFALAGGIAGVQALGAQVVALLGHFDDIGDGAKKLDITAESFQRIKLAAELSGASIEGLSGALLKMTAGLQRGGAEGEKIQKALANLNIDVAAFIAAKPEDKLRLLTEGFQKAKEEGRGLSEIQDLFKKQFIDLIPLLTTSAEEMANIANQQVVSNEDVELLAAANDQLDTFKNRLTVVAGTSLATLMAGWDGVDAAIRRVTGNAVGLWDTLKGIIGSVTGLTAVANILSGGDEPPPTAPQDTSAEAPATPPPQRASTLPGLAAAGVNPDDLLTSSLPGLAAATAPVGQSQIELREKQEMSNLIARLASPDGEVTTPQVAATNQQSGAASANANRRRYDAATLKALEENNKILATLAAY